eukprot:TRINITY_DN35729_c0_g1_i1.p1 TRINITY_DN35729_c0_g1~~TRINITY_DN35729_c0_g1_i1.p1  ORF type:complete len:416 (+),score=169.98 TRINITY_DN35729_c0_g1_i1:99-1250(+)
MKAVDADIKRLLEAKQQEEARLSKLADEEGHLASTKQAGLGKFEDALDACGARVSEQTENISRLTVAVAEAEKSEIALENKSSNLQSSLDVDAIHSRAPLSASEQDAAGQTLELANDEVNERKEHIEAMQALHESITAHRAELTELQAHVAEKEAQWDEQIDAASGDVKELRQNTAAEVDELYTQLVPLQKQLHEAHHRIAELEGNLVAAQTTRMQTQTLRCAEQRVLSDMVVVVQQRKAEIEALKEQGQEREAALKVRRSDMAKQFHTREVDAKDRAVGALLEKVAARTAGEESEFPQAEEMQQLAQGKAATSTHLAGQHKARAEDASEVLERLAYLEQKHVEVFQQLGESRAVLLAQGTSKAELSARLRFVSGNKRKADVL